MSVVAWPIGRPGPGTRFWAIAVAAVFATALALGPAAARPVAAADATFGAPSTSAEFGQQVAFDQPVSLTTVPDRVELLILLPGAIGPNVTEVPAPSGTGSRTLRFALALADGHILPNTRLTATWRLTFGTRVETGPPVSVLYADTRFAWRTMTGPLVRIHWYEGDDAFGQRALSIAEQGVRKAETTFGVTEKDPIDFFVYAAQTPFYDALGPGTRENVGGEAHAEIRTMFALITPTEVDASWVRTVIPHELTHLVFNTAVENPYHFPPRWLNEGLAVYLSQGFDVSDRQLVASAAADGTLTPLGGLTGQFPSTSNEFFLAYAESVSAVDYLIRTYGQPALVALVRSYAKGVTEDEAFSAALGVDAQGFDAAWRTSLGANPPVKVGPQPAPPGPVPPGWSGTPATPRSSGNQVGSQEPSTSATGPAATPGDGAAGPGAGSGGGGSPDGPTIALVATMTVGAVALGLFLAGRRRPG
jgi:hypothetical protein